MGQGQTKASKRRETNGEQGPSPKKEAKKSPKKSKTPKSSSTASVESQQGQGQVQIEVRESSPTRLQGRQSVSPAKDSTAKAGAGIDIVISDESIVKPVDSKLIESPPKPKRTYEVEFIEPEKENVPEDATDSGLNVSEIQKVESSPVCEITMNGTHGEPLTPVKAQDLNHVPQATSTPAPNGTISTGRRRSGGVSSDDDHTDVSDDEAFSSDQQFHSASPTASNVSLKSFSTINSASLRAKSDSYGKRSEVNFGKFYNTSYLEKVGSHTQKRSQSEPAKHNPNQFIRPANFSYSKEPPSFLKNKKSGMMAIAQPKKTVVKTATPRRSTSPAATGIRRNLEAVKMSTFPAGKRPPPKEIPKIERDDWPAPPSPAAILPEILRQRRKSRGEEDEDDDEDEVVEDPKIKREIAELKKFKDESGIGTVIYKELEEAKTLPHKPLDPWKASRVPNAAYEPKFQTRYQSPMFASPSRFLDKSRRRAWDDSDIRGYRTMSTIGNWPAPRPGYGLAPRAATLPVQGVYGGPLEDYFYGLDASEGHETRVSMSSVNTEASKVTSTIFDHPGVSLMTFQRNTWHTAAAPSVYAYDRLKISNFDLPKDVDRNQLEIHLDTGDFEEIFGMKPDEFSHLPEWKRNDMKKKKDLY